MKKSSLESVPLTVIACAVLTGCAATSTEAVDDEQVVAEEAHDSLPPSDAKEQETVPPKKPVARIIGDVTTAYIPDDCGVVKMVRSDCQ